VLSLWMVWITAHPPCNAPKDPSWVAATSELGNESRRSGCGRTEAQELRLKALVVDDPWISLILGGEKTWEMRSTHTKVRGRIALVRKGSGTVVGLADVTESIGPLDEIAWRAHRARHRIPVERYAETARWNIAWQLENVTPLAKPVPYAHPSGAVIWVTLSEQEAASLQAAAVQLPVPRAIEMPRPVAPSIPKATRAPMPVDLAATQGQLVPVARDGSWFSPDLRRPRGGYTIGAKGEEFVVANYAEALASLRLMNVPRWRRPNANGNWGIVAAIEWKAADQMAR